MQPGNKIAVDFDLRNGKQNYRTDKTEKWINEIYQQKTRINLHNWIRFFLSRARDLHVCYNELREERSNNHVDTR